MKKIILITAVILLSTVLQGFALSYELDDYKEVNLGSVEKLVFRLDSARCGLCISTVNFDKTITGSSASNKLTLALEGTMTSNQGSAVPALYVSEDGRVLNISLYKNEKMFFGLAQTGRVYFSANIPESFIGDIEIELSSSDITVSDISADKLNIKSSSGDVSLDRISAELLTIEASSGKINAGLLNAARSIDITASSGDIKIDELRSSEIGLKASSGDIKINRLSADNTRIKLSSGSLELLKAEGGIQCEISSGKTTIEIATLSGDIDIDSKSGRVRLSLPAGSAFDADLGASSGKITTDFTILGDVTKSDEDRISGKVNGGGRLVRVKASSGDISISRN